MKEHTRLTSVLLDFRLRQLLVGDLALGLAGAGGGIYLGINHPAALQRAAGTAAQIVALVVGLALAGMAIQSAFMNPIFLRKTRAIGSDPVHYLAPLLFTATTGILSAISVLVLSALPHSAPSALFAVLGGSSGLLVFWTLGGLLHNLTTLIGFVRLQADAAEVPDDLEVLKPGSSRGGDERRAAN